MNTKILFLVFLTLGLLVVFVAPVNASQQPYNFQVLANANSSSLGPKGQGQACVNTDLAPTGGIQINVGDTVSGSASGQWGNDSTYSLYGPNGKDGTIECTGFKIGYLVMKFVPDNGASIWLGAGSNFTKTFTQSGKLYFAFSDSDQTNNTGSMSVSLTITSATIANIACSTDTQCGTNSLTGSPFCQNGNIYQNYRTYTCNNPGTASSLCSNSIVTQLQTTCTGSQTCTNGSCTNSCTQNYQQECFGNNLYWYDSCGNQGSLIQYCSNGCYNNTCQNSYNNNNYNNNYNYNNYSNYGSCAYHAYRQCVGNNVYWYDSCGTQQDLYYSCNGGLTCQYGQCTAYIQPIQPVQPIQTYSNYVAHYKTACSGNSIHWFDSLGAESGLDKNCSDNNSCTLDSCSKNDCQNTLKCDGSTCATGSTDYNTYCQTTQATTTPASTNANGLSITLYSKLDANSAQWQKTIKIGSNSTVYFMVTVNNNSTKQIDDVNVSANIPTEISSLGNLQINGVMVSGDIVSGINIGSVAPAGTKSITFEGKTQDISAQTAGNSAEQAIASTSVSGAQKQSDSVSMSFTATQTTNATAAAISTSQDSSGFMGFLKRWYLWILTGLVLIFLFVIVFKRFSSDV